MNDSMKKLTAMLLSSLTVYTLDLCSSAMDSLKKQASVPKPPVVIEVKSCDRPRSHMYFHGNPSNLKKLTCWYCQHPINLNETCVLLNCGSNFFNPTNKSYFDNHDMVTYYLPDLITFAKLNHVMHSECSEKINHHYLNCPYKCPIDNNNNFKKYKVYFDIPNLVHIRDSSGLDLDENHFKLSMHLPDEYQNLTCCRCNKGIPVGSPFVFYGCSERLFNEINIFDNENKQNQVMRKNLNNFSKIKDHAVCCNCALEVGLPYSTNKEKFACPKCKNESQYVTLIYYPAAKHEDVNLLKGDIIASLDREEC